METPIILYRGSSFTYVVSLPMRDGNRRVSIFQRITCLVVSLPMRDGNASKRPSIRASTAVVSLPMRDGN